MIEAVSGAVARPQTPHARFEEFPAACLESSLGRRFLDTVARFPDRTALIADERRLTYRELGERARRIANALVSARSEGRSATGHVAVLSSDAFDMVASILGTLIGGLAYVPLDPDYPAERLRAICGHAEPDVVLTDRAGETVRSAARLAPHATVLHIDGALRAEPLAIADTATSPDAIASLIYTSGSTGSPKGVLQNHRNVLFHIRHLTNRFRITESDRHSALASFSFDASTSDLFCAVLNGAALVVMDVRRQGLASTRRTLAEHGVTLYHSTPTIFRGLASEAAAGERLPALRLVLLGGEPVLRHDAELMRALTDEHCQLVNGYGSTETSGFLALCTVDADSAMDEAAIPLGDPVPGVAFEVRDPDGTPAREYGELVALSDHLGVGYWREPEATERVFAHEIRDGRPVNVYHSGDLVVRGSDGRLRLKARVDRQVKIRGVRVDQLEIENALAGLGGITQAAVTVFDDPAGRGAELVAYIQPAGHSPSPAEVRATLAKSLPAAMIPTRVVAVDRLPLTPTGKVDYAALAGRPLGPTATDAPGGAPAPAEGGLLGLVTGIWLEVLGLPSVAADQNFFDAGGHSLALTLAHARLEQRLGRAVPVYVLLERPTIREQVAYLSGDDDRERRDQNIAERAERRNAARRRREAERISRTGGMRDAAAPRSSE